MDPKHVAYELASIDANSLGLASKDIMTYELVSRDAHCLCMAGLDTVMKITEELHVLEYQ